MRDTSPLMNPYVVGRVVTGEGRFFGREEELRRLRGLLLGSATPPHVSVTGETRSGKTSLLMEFVQREEVALGSRYCVSVLDLSADFDRGTVRDFYRQIGDFAIDALSTNGHDVSDIASVWERAVGGQSRQSIQFHVKMLLTRAAEAARPLLFILDEFDFAPHLVSEDSDAFKILRSLGLHTDTTFVVASRAEIDEIERDAGISSNFAGIFDLTPIRLVSLEDAAARELCQTPLQRMAAGEAWHEEVVHRLIALSGRQPYFLQGLCHRLFHEAWGKAAGEQCLVLESIAGDVFRPLFRTQARRLVRGGLLDSLRGILGGREEHIDRSQTDRLERLGYVVRDEAGRFQPFTPLLLGALGLSSGSDGEGVGPFETEPLEELLASWGLCIGGCNVLVEGETDRELLSIAAQTHRHETGEDLLDDLTIVPAGLGRSGGVRPVARRLVTVMEAARGRGTRAIAMLDYDDLGRRIAEALDRLGAQKNKDYLLLERADFPIRNYNGPVQVEIEDLLAQSLLDGFVSARPEAIEEKLDRGGDGVRYGWRGQFKDELVGYVREHGQAQHFERLIRLLRRLRSCFQ